ncbi:MAG: YciI family protein [Planctomycetales bacterium]|nr:YciI family protein [Planctomycetales bacterium]
MRFLLLMYHAEGAFSETELPREMASALRVCHDLHAKGQYVDASPLQPVATATSIRIRNGARLLSDGPFAETKEQLGGYVLIEAESLEQAIEAASRFPAAKVGTVEIRQCWDG